MTKETVYIKAEQNVEVRHPDVTLGEILKLECSNPDIVPKLSLIHI